MIRMISVIGILAMLCGMSGQAEECISLAGEWRFRLDPGDDGVASEWFRQVLPETVRLPGSLDENGKGTPVSAVHVAHLTRLYEYTGPAWYQKTVTIPREWSGKRIVLFLERCHWESRIWVDGVFVGIRDSLCVPHIYDLSPVLSSGEHQITLRIDNSIRYAVGNNAHSVTEHTQTNWNGVIGRVELQACDPVWIDSVQVFPKIADKSITVRVGVGNNLSRSVRCRIMVSVLGKKEEFTRDILPGETVTDEVTLALGPDMPLWDEFSPRLTDLEVSLRTFGRKIFRGSQVLQVGFREMGRSGTQFSVNGRPTFLRGNLECCIFPRTGYPPMDEDYWLSIFRLTREYGFNHVRFHSWCPPEAAFRAADQLGLMLHVETPVWTELGTDPVLDQFVYAEGDRILQTYGNHPSFCMLAVGNEPSGPNKDRFLKKIVAYWQAKDPRRAYTTCAGWPELPGSDYHVLPSRDGKPIRLHGGPLGPTTAFDYARNIEGCEVPIVAHELGQWCVYPCYDEIAKYTGLLRARNLETFRDALAAHHMAGMDRVFSRASGMLQLLLYKADIEAVLRTRGIGGFQLLSLQDFPGQGSALVGFLDAFWDTKGYVTPEQFRAFNSETVPLARMEKFTYTAGEIMQADIEMAHFGGGPMKDATVRWHITENNGAEVASGMWHISEIPLGNGIPIGQVHFPLQGLPVPARFTLKVEVENTPFSNHWSFWVYPAHTETDGTGDVLVARKWDKKVDRALRMGKKVLLLPSYLAPDKRVNSAFESIFWNMQWFPGQQRQLGVLCDPSHPAFAQFPNDGYTDWQWWDLLNRSRVVRLDDFPPDFEPIVRVIDDWNRNARLGSIFEAVVGTGRLLVCTLDIEKNLDKRPAAAALRRSLIGYMRGDRFVPKNKVDLTTVRSLFQEPDVMVVRADSQVPGYVAENAVDDDATTIWHTPWEGTPAPYPHEIVLRLREPKRISGLFLMPRQDVANGFIAAYEVYVGRDGEKWEAPVARGQLDRNAERKWIPFGKATWCQYIRLVALSGHDGNPFCAIAELQPVSGTGL